jgi:hypothetical protein
MSTRCALRHATRFSGSRFGVAIRACIRAEGESLVGQLSSRLGAGTVRSQGIIAALQG